MSNTTTLLLATKMFQLWNGTCYKVSWTIQKGFEAFECEVELFEWDSKHSIANFRSEKTQMIFQVWIWLSRLSLLNKSIVVFLVSVACFKATKTGCWKGLEIPKHVQTCCCQESGIQVLYPTLKNAPYSDYEQVSFSTANFAALIA